MDKLLSEPHQQQLDVQDKSQGNSQETINVGEAPTLKQRKCSSKENGSTTTSLKIQPKDFIIKNQKHFLEVYSLCNNSTLGEGGHGSILKVLENDHEGKPIGANKCVKKFEKRNLFFKNSEVQSLKSLDHPNIVKIYEYFDERDAFYIVMEQVTGRDLLDEIAYRGKPFNEKEACSIVNQILLALTYTHSKGLIHRDIKLDNIMVSPKLQSQTSSSQLRSNQNLSQVKSSCSQIKSDGLSENSEDRFCGDTVSDNTSTKQAVKDQQSTQSQNDSTASSSVVQQQQQQVQQQDQEQVEWSVKLIDWSFGLDTNSKKNKYQNSICGSLYYQAPEYFNKKYNEKIDIWALGVVLYSMLSNKLPFLGKTKFETQASIQKDNVTFGTEWDNISDEAKDLIIKMLEKDPEKRQSASELLNHIWFKTVKGNNQIIQDKELIKNNLRHLKQFKCDNEFQKAILTYISVNLVSSQEKVQLERLFMRLDTNQDGRLSKEEILEGFNQIWGENYINEDEIKLIFEQVDSDKSDSIDYSEFITATLERNTFNEKSYLQKAFNLFDKDGDGQITKEEILRILGSSQDDGSDSAAEIEEQIQQMIDQIDTSQDGKISLDEFCTMIQRYSNTEIQMSQ